MNLAQRFHFAVVAQDLQSMSSQLDNDVRMTMTLLESRYEFPDGSVYASLFSEDILEMVVEVTAFPLMFFPKPLRMPG